MLHSAIVLSHDEQRERLRAGCPEAVPVAHTLGDPCADELEASAPFREEYRTGLGIAPGQKLVVITSTWGTRSLLAQECGRPEIRHRIPFALVHRALAELPRDEYRVLAAVHPNAWYGHSGRQVRSWLAPYLREGLLLPRPESDTWKAALCAADVFLGDHGSLTLYGVRHGLPGVLAAFDEDTVAPDSPMALLGRLLPRTAPFVPLRAQLEGAMRQQPGDPDLARAAGALTSRPGEALRAIRTLCYERLRLPEPAHPVHARPVPLPPPDPSVRTAPLPPPVLAEVRPVAGARERVRIRRYPASLHRPADLEPHDPHLVVTAGEPEPHWAHTAEIVVAPRTADPAQAATELFRRHPGCALVAVPDPRDRARSTLVLRDGGNHRSYQARWENPAWWSDTAAAASVLYGRLSEGGDETETEAEAEDAVGTEGTGAPAHRITVGIGAPGPGRGTAPVSVLVLTRVADPGPTGVAAPGARPVEGGEPAQGLLGAEAAQVPVEGER